MSIPTHEFIIGSDPSCQRCGAITYRLNSDSARAKYCNFRDLINHQTMISKIHRAQDVAIAHIHLDRLAARLLAKFA